MCLNETYTRVRVGKHLSDMFTIKNGVKERDALSPLIFTFTVGYAILSVQVNQEGLKCNGTHQLVVYADDINMLEGSLHIVTKKAEAFLLSNKENGLEVNAD